MTTPTAEKLTELYETAHKAQNGLKILCQMKLDNLNSTKFSDYNMALMDACTIADGQLAITPNTIKPEDLTPLDITKTVAGV